MAVGNHALPVSQSNAARPDLAPMPALLSHSERKVEVIRWRQLFDCRNLRSVRTLSHDSRELIQIPLFTGGRDFNTSVGKICYVAGKAESSRVNADEPSKSDSLHTTPEAQVNRRHVAYPLLRSTEANAAAIAASGGLPLNW